MLKLNTKSIEWAINHINKYNDTYVFPLPFEFKAINYFKNEVVNYLSQQDILHYGVRPYRTEITPKSKVGFRISTQLDPFDSIIYNGVLYEISTDIEKQRILPNQDIVFSYRLKPEVDGTLYDSKYNWDSFNKKAQAIVETGVYSHVVVTDIADFFSSIYLHNVETSIREAVRPSGKVAHGEALIQIIKAMHSNQTHKGLPIGPQFSRPIAELILIEIDKILINNNIKFIRYVDDYRIFCNSEVEAYKALSFLAQKFYDLRNLKLNEQKTKILTIDEFKQDYLKIFEDKETDRMLDQFYSLCEKLEISPSSYDDLDIEHLEPEQIEEIEQLNILELLESELNKDEVDLGYVKFLLNNLARFDNTEVADLILCNDNIIKVFPILRSFINYLKKVRSFDINQKHNVGRAVINLFNQSFITELQFNRSWLLHLFSDDNEWNNSKFFYDLYNKYQDDFTRREIVQCLGRAGNTDFFRENRMVALGNLNPWLRRSFIGAFSCLSKSEREALFNSRKYIQQDYLESVVDRWAIKNPY